jgi:hypothetical protein
LVEIWKKFQPLVFKKKFVNRDYLVYCLIKGVSSQEELGASIVVTDCPGCIMQLRGGFDKRQSNIEVLAIEDNPFQCYLNAGKIGRA